MFRHRTVTWKAPLLLGLTALLLVSLVRITTAQQDSCLDRTFAVNVLTEKGESVNGLTAKNFRAKYQHETVQIVSAMHDTAPRRIVIVLDASGTMYQDSQWGFAIGAAKELFSAAPWDMSFALLTFANHVEDKTALSEGRQVVGKELSTLGRKDWKSYKGPTRKTALFDALLEGLGSFGASGRGDVVYAITDGGDNASHIDFPEVRTRFLSMGVRLFCFLVRPSLAVRGRTPEEASGPEELTRLIHVTGGDFASVELGSPSSSIKKDWAVVESGTALLVGEITEFYRVEIHLPQFVDKERDWNLQVVDEAGKKNTHLRVIYPRRLAPCP
jgi:hypothetical protein